MLFKQNGKVIHIIPVYERDYTPEGFYEKYLPQPKLTKAQKIHMGTLSFLGKFNSSKRKDPVKCYMEISDLEKIINNLKNDQSDIYEMLCKKYKNVKIKMLKEVNKNETVFTK